MKQLTRKKFLSLVVSGLGSLALTTSFISNRKYADSGAFTVEDFLNMKGKSFKADLGEDGFQQIILQEVRRYPKHFQSPDSNREVFSLSWDVPANQQIDHRTIDLYYPDRGVIKVYIDGLRYKNGLNRMESIWA